MLGHDVVSCHGLGARSRDRNRARLSRRTSLWPCARRWAMLKTLFVRPPLGMTSPQEVAMRIFIGLDGGGTGCRAQAICENGQRSAVLSGGAANLASDFNGGVREISALLAAVLDAAHALVPGATAITPQIVLGLAGATEADASTRLQAALPYRDLTICGDIDISLAGAFGDGDGIVMAVGTGSVLARQSGGQVLRLGGYGLHLGDEGSGAWLGREALRRALHARDGLGANGPLVAAIWQDFGTLAEVIGFAARARPADFATLAPLVLAQDRAHCPVAAAILDRGCAYLLAAIRQLQRGADGLPVAGLGGLGPALLDRIVAQGGAQLNAVAPKGTALDGALWMAQRLHAGVTR
ncbi:MAG: ATPase [Rhodobacteraceae bacterium]|nr:MAG: ATPase [Paracoccaceae bacterium]